MSSRYTKSNGIGRDMSGRKAPPMHAQVETEAQSLSPTKTRWKAWFVRGMVVLVPVVVVVAAGHHMLEQRVEELWRDFAEEFRQAPLPQTRRAIDETGEEVFAHVYAAIPALLDWHYSFRGRLTEPFLAVSGRMGKRIESQLLEGLQERIEVVRDSVGSVLQDEGLTELELWLDREVAPGMRWVYEPMLARRFVAAVRPPAFAVSISIGPTGLADSVTERLSPGAGNAGFRAGRSVIVRSVGRVGSGIVGGVAAWLALDFALGKVEEWRGRDQLEQGLTALVDQEKEDVKTALRRAVNDFRIEGPESLHAPLT